MSAAPPKPPAPAPKPAGPPGAPPPSLAGPIGGPPKPGPPPPGLPRAVRQSGTPPRGPTHTTPPPGALDPLRKPPVPGKPITPPPVPGNPPVTPTKALPPLAPGAVTNSPLPPTSNPATLPTPTAPANKGGLPPMAWTNGGAAPPPRTIPPAKPNPSPAPKPAPLPAPAPKPPVPAPVPAPVPKPLPKAPAPETTPPPSVSSPAPIKNQASGIKPWNPISESGGHWDMRPADAAEEQDELESVSSLGDHHGFSMETSSTMSYPKNPPADANRLAHAAAAGDNEMVTHLLASGSHENTPLTKDMRGNTALHYAAARGNVQTLELLLNQPGTDIAQCIDCTTVDQATPLHYAVYHGQTEIVQYLLQKGADPSKTNELGENGLHLASIQLNIELVTMMLANPNINPSSAAMNGRQALHYAAIRGNVPIVEALLARNCDPTIIDACGATAINLAYDAKNMEVLKLMMDHTPPEDASDVRDHKGATALHRAAASGQIDTVRKLIAEMSWIDVMDKNGLTPYLAAMHAGHKEIQDLLKSKGASEDFKLHWAACNGHDDLVEEIISKKTPVCNVDRHDQKGHRALHLACKNGHATCADLLLKAGADVHSRIQDMQNVNGEERSKNRTPIILAAMGAHCFMTGCGKIDPECPNEPPMQCGHCKVLLVLLSHGAKVNQKDYKCGSPLYYAALSGCRMSAKVLLEAGADHTMVEENGNTPLHGAAIRGHYEAAEELLDAKNPDIIIDVLNKKSETPLIIATYLHHVPVVELLKSRGARIAFRLHWAAHSGNETLLRELLTSDHSPYDVDHGGLTALHSAAVSGNTVCAQILIDHARAHAHADWPDIVDLKSKQVNLSMELSQSTPLLAAASVGDPNMVKLLLEKGAALDSSNALDRTAIHVASENGHVGVIAEVMKYLALDQNASKRKVLNMKTKTKQYTAQLIAADKGSQEMLMMFIKAGADIFEVDFYGNSPLHLAVKGNTPEHLACVKTCVSHGAPLNKKNTEGFAPLHLATQFGRADVVKYLLQVGAQHSLPTAKLQTPLMLAACVGHIELVNLLKNAGASFDDVDISNSTALHMAAGRAKRDNVEMVNLLLQNMKTGGGSNRVKAIDAEDSDHNTPLHMACAANDTKTVQALVDAGADVKKVTKTQDTALIKACKQGNLDIVRILLDRGAEVNAQDKNNFSALGASALNGHTDIIKVLIKHGANVNMTDYKGDTPLTLASSKGHLTTCELLLKDQNIKSEVYNHAGMAAIHVAASVNNWPIMELLMKQRKEGQLPTYMGRLPIHTAVSYGSIDVVRELLDSGVDVNQACMQNPVAKRITGWQNFDPEAVKVDGWTLETKIGHLTQEEKSHVDVVNSESLDTKEAELTTAYFLLANNNGVVYWELEIIDAPANEPCNVTVGVAVPQSSYQYKLGTLPGTYGYVGATGHTYSGLLSSRMMYSSKFGKGDTIGVIWNKAYRAISYTKNGVHLGIAFRNIDVADNILWASVGVEKQNVKVKASFLETQGQWKANLDEVLYTEELRNNTGDMPPWDHKSQMYPLHFSVCRNDVRNIEVMHELLSRGATIDQQDVDGWTPLHKAAFNGWKEGMELLIAKGADVNAETAFKSFPLLFTVLNSHTEATRVLLDRKADPSKRNYQGRTLLMIAASIGNTSIMDMLLKHKAELKARDKHGKTAMQYACNEQTALFLEKALQQIETYRVVYEINQQAEIKRGAMGIVKMARHTELGLSVAIKFHQDKASRDHSFRILQDLSSIYCATLPSSDHAAYCFDDHTAYPETPFALVTYGGEQDLYDFLEENGQGNIAENQCRYIFECIASSVHHMHVKGYVHHDLKPKNVVRFYDGRYRLIDFETTRRVQSNGVTTTTAAYAAPEVASHVLSHQGMMCSQYYMDIWALGCILFQIMAKQCLHECLFDGEELRHKWKDCSNQNASNKHNLSLLQALRQEQVDRAVEEYVVKKSTSHKLTEQVASLLKSMLKVEGKQRISIQGVISHGFLKGGGNTVTMDAKALQGLKTDIKTMHGKVDQILHKVIHIEERTLILADLPGMLQKGFSEMGSQLKMVRTMMMQGKCECPSTFVVLPDISPKEMLGSGKSGVTKMKKWIGLLGEAYSSPNTIQHLAKKLGRQQFKLFLKCETCFESQGTGYTIETAAEWAVKLLPAMQFAFVAGKAYNVAASIGRMFFPFVPCIPDEMLQEAKGVMDLIGSKSTAADFACIQSRVETTQKKVAAMEEKSRTFDPDDIQAVVSEAEAGVEGDADADPDGYVSDDDPERMTEEDMAPDKQADASLRQLRMFLKDTDPQNNWGGLSCIEIDKTIDGQTSEVVWVCAQCLSGQNDRCLATGGGPAPTPGDPQSDSAFTQLPTTGGVKDRKQSRSESQPTSNQLKELPPKPSRGSEEGPPAPDPTAKPPVQRQRQRSNSSPGLLGCFGRSSVSPEPT